MTKPISSTSRYRRLLPTFVARVGELRLGVAIVPQDAVIGERTP